MESLVQHYGYWAVLIGTFLEGETILVLGGFAAHRGLLWLPGVMLAAFVGSLASDQMFFFLGRRRGEVLLAARPAWQLKVQRFRHVLDRYHTPVILLFRFMYGLRNIAPFALGMSRVPTLKFVVLNVIGAAVWAVAVASLGWVVGNAATQLIGHVERYELRVAALIVVAGTTLWLLRLLRDRRRRAAATEFPLPDGRGSG